MHTQSSWASHLIFEMSIEFVVFRRHSLLHSYDSFLYTHTLKAVGHRIWYLRWGYSLWYSDDTPCYIHMTHFYTHTHSKQLGIAVFVKHIYYTSGCSWATRVRFLHSWAVHDTIFFFLYITHLCTHTHSKQLCVASVIWDRIEFVVFDVYLIKCFHLYDS